VLISVPGNCEWGNNMNRFYLDTQKMVIHATTAVFILLPDGDWNLFCLQMKTGMFN
jgi:hypothetical protein